jgi:predicted metal-dependent enzyme (double-stranded beta helix superfamily)
MNRKDERNSLIASVVADVRAIEAREGVTRESLEHIRERLARLAERTDLFTLDDFPPPKPGDPRSSCLYRLAEDDDHRFALYANTGNGRYASPAHNHTTWAVIVGVTGEELNRFYDRIPDGGVREKGQHVVRQGTGVAFMPDDFHSIHIDGAVLNFHMYGLALEQLPRREYYNPAKQTWAVYPPHSDIREARPGRA